MATTRIIIIGGGFAGIKCARALRKQLPKDQYEIVLFNKENHMVFHPLLAEVVGASLSPEDVVAPLRQMLPKIHCRTEDVSNIDLANSEIEYEGYDGSKHKLHYDHVVIACGGIVNLGTVPGMADHAFPVKTIGDAITLRAHVLEQFEKAEVCEDPEKRRFHLSFIVVGGGYSGVEVAGEINDLAKGSNRFFQNIRPADIKVTLIHSQDQLLPDIGSDLREFARKELVKAGINVLLKKRVSVATTEGVTLNDKSFIAGGTIVCTIGTSMSPVVEKLTVAKNNGRLMTKPDMSLNEYQNAWALGDCSQIVNAFDGKMSPPTGQFAERQGRQCANNIVRVIKGEATQPFSFKPVGQLCSLGGHTAVAEMMGVHISGFLAWFFWRGIYLFKLPTWSRRIKAGFDWAWQVIFSRDLSHLKTNQTERVTHAYYQPGDYIFRQGEPATCFYTIEKGEVEVVREDEQGGEEVLAILGQGSFFGEMALINNNPRNASVRARTTVEIVAMGRHIFTQFSNSLEPLRRLIMQTMTKRSGAIWSKTPEVRTVLHDLPVTKIMEPAPFPLLNPETSFAEVLGLFESNPLDFFYISKENQQLDGVLTRTDLIKAMEAGATKSTRIGDYISVNPVAVTVDDSCLVAAATMRDYNFKWLPVISCHDNRKIVGYIRAQTMFARILMAENVEKSMATSK